MKAKAIDEARLRLKIVEDAVAAITAEERSNDSIRSAWWSFLLAVAGIYSKLEQGSKGDPTSERWVSTKKKERKEDSMLQYLQQARNTDEHLLEGSVEEHGIGFSAGNRWTRKTGEDSFSVQHGRPVAINLTPPGFHLRPVRNRGVTYDPPTGHLGKPFQEPTWAEVMRLALSYARQMIDEAERLPAH